MIPLWCWNMCLKNKFQHYEIINHVVDSALKGLLPDINQSIVFFSSGGTTSDDTKSPSVSPTFTLGFLDGSTGATLTTGAVGLAVKLSLSIPANEASKYSKWNK